MAKGQSIWQKAASEARKQAEIVARRIQRRRKTFDGKLEESEKQVQFYLAEECRFLAEHEEKAPKQAELPVVAPVPAAVSPVLDDPDSSPEAAPANA